MGLLAGWSNESIVPCALVVTALCILSNFVTKQKTPLWQYTGFAGLLAGAALLLSAPGSYARNDAYGGFAFSGLGGFARHLAGSTFYLFRHASGIILVVTVLYAAVLLSKRSLKDKLLPGFYLLAAALTHLALQLPAIYSQRSMYGIVLFLMLAAVRCIAMLLDDVPPGAPLAVLVCLCLLFTGSYRGAMEDNLATRETVQAREAYIEEQKAAGNLDIVVEAVHPQTKYNALFGGGVMDLFEDTDAWANRLKAKYYGIDSIRALDAPYGLKP